MVWLLLYFSLSVFFLFLIRPSFIWLKHKKDIYDLLKTKTWTNFKIHEGHTSTRYSFESETEEYELILDIRTGFLGLKTYHYFLYNRGYNLQSHHQIGFSLKNLLVYGYLNPLSLILDSKLKHAIRTFKKPQKEPETISLAA